MKEQNRLLQQIIDNYTVIKDSSPEFKTAYLDLNAETFKDGFLNSKTKRLMALAVGISQGCTGCILFQTREALERGATTNEILETCTLAATMAGNMGGAQASRVVAYLREQELV